MATYNFSQNVLNNEIGTEEICHITPAPSASSSLIDSASLSIPSKTTDFMYDIHKNFEELPRYLNPTGSYAVTEVKREPCQVSEVTTSAVPEIQLSRSRHKYKTALNASGVKIESISPKLSEVDDVLQIKTNVPTHAGTEEVNEWSQEPVIDAPISQSQKEINYFGIRVADLATAGCGNIYLAGANFVSAESTEEINPGILTMSRPSTFWQYPNSFPVDPVLSMSPVGLQCSRDSSRGQLVLFPTTTAMESFPQATFMWPTYIPQTSGSTLSTSQNLIFPSLSPQPNSQSLSYAPHIQFFGTNYLTTTASATASTFCQHSQINRFVSISSDIKRLEQTEKKNDIKIEECGNEYNSLRKSDKLTATNATKSKLESDLNCIQLECSIPILPSETSHIVNSSESINLPICVSNLTQSTNANGRLPITQDVASVPHSPKMQDVNIQTDTPVSSEDEIFLEVSRVDADFCHEYVDEKNKNGLTTHFHKNVLESGVILKENTQSHIFKGSYLDQTEKKIVESEFAASIKSKKPFDNFCSNNQNSPISLDCISFTETIRSIPEMSGLELLSNISTGTFDNHNTLKNVYIKSERYENLNDNVHVSETHSNTENFNFEATAAVGKHNIQNSLPSSNNQLPLGGLNLLCALAEQRIQEEVECNNHSEIANEITCDTKRRKCKHAKLKSRKKSNYSKNNEQKLAKVMIHCPEKTGSKPNNSKQHVNIKNAFEKVDTSYKNVGKWTDSQELFLAMESDMRMRLADITRQYKKKKRKLDEINKLKKWKRPSSEYKFSNISYKNPNFICFLEKYQKKPILPRFEAIESKTDISTQNNKISGCVVDKFKINSRSKLTEIHQLKYKTLFANNRMPHKKQYSENESEKICLKNKRKANKITQSLRKSCVTRNVANKNLTDRELILSVEHLYCNETRVLTDMGGLFYAGVLKPLQPPDVYSVTLDGERGNKSHIMSREDIFKDTILEVTPKTIDNVPTGTRLCAYWSQQYRCLYPGKAIDSENYDETSGFVSVEFDDGDSGKIRLENIRLLLSDYPVVEYSKNPFNTIGKYMKTTCIQSTLAPKASEGQHYEEFKESLTETQTEIKNQSDNISKSLNQDYTSECILNEVDHKHRKHKKKKKNKKDNRKSSLKSVSDKEHRNINECDQDTKQPNFDYRNTKKKCCIEIITSPIYVEKNSAKHLHGGCSPSLNSDALPEHADKSKHREKVDAYNGKGSKIAAFLPERQLWSWLGHAYRRAGLKGRTRKSFYKSITRGKEIISVGECAVFLSTGRPDRPYIGRIEALWETSSHKVVRVRWFYHPEETTGCPVLKYPGGLFVSPHEDENDVQTISHRCEVIEFSLYITKFGTNYEQYQAVYENNDTFYLSGYYNPRLQLLKLEPHIPIENDTCI